MIDALGEPFFQRVLVAALLASVASGIIGSYVVSKGIASVTGGLSHAAFGGVGLGYWLGFSPLLGATGFGVAAAVLVGLAHRRLGSGLDTLVSMVWAVGMALGVVFVSFAPGYAPDLTSYLFGSLLFVPWDYVVWVGALDVLIIAAVVAFHPYFQAVCFDEEYAEVAGIPAERVLLGLLALTALAVVTLIRVVGVILAIALVTIPAATARHWARTLPGMMVVSVVVCATTIITGLLGSYALSSSLAVSVPPGPLAILLAAMLYGISAMVRRRAA